MAKASLLEMIDKLGMSWREAAQAHGFDLSKTIQGEGVCSVCKQVVGLLMDEGERYTDDAGGRDDLAHYTVVGHPGANDDCDCDGSWMPPERLVAMKK